MDLKKYITRLFEGRISKACTYAEAWSKVVYKPSGETDDIRNSFRGCEVYQLSSGRTSIRVRVSGTDEDGPDDWDAVSTETPLKDWSGVVDDLRVIRPDDGNGPYFIADAGEMAEKIRIRQKLWSDRISQLQYARSLVAPASEAIGPALEKIDSVLRTYPTICDEIRLFLILWADRER